MATISLNLQTIKNSTLAIKQAIIDKGGTIDGDITTWANSIANIPSGGSGKGDVTFYDYDGTILHSFSKNEFLALNELPSLPTQPGLTCQGWNYDITKAKTYVEEYGKLDIGATYITDDGKTRLYIKIAAEGRMTVPLYFSQTVNNGVTIDWGDGSNTQTLSGTGNLNTSHTYTLIGDYCITLTVAPSCTLGLGHNSRSCCVIGSIDNKGKVYGNMLQKVEIGTGVTSFIGLYTFFRCHSLFSVVIPNSITYIGESAFSDCYSLNSVVIPNSVINIGTSAFSSCLLLSSLVISDSVTLIGEKAFYCCKSLSSVTIPNSVKLILASAFQNCETLSSVVIPVSITLLGNSVFHSCLSLSSVVIPNSVTSIGTYAFKGCYSLSSVVIPNSITSIKVSTFTLCYSLSSVSIPESVTTIETDAFNNCYSLSSIVIPSSVASISGNVFKLCYGMAFYDFSNHTLVPTLPYTSAFSDIPSDCKIIVPDNLYDTWIAATNWSTYASYIIKKSDWDALQN